MTRKDYIAVAKILKDAQELSGGKGEAVIAIGQDLADLFKQDNSAFNRARFMEAAGFGAPAIPAAAMRQFNNRHED